MKITKIELIHASRGVTVHAGEIGWSWVRVHSDEGQVGLGESYPLGEAERGVIRGALARVLLGQDPRDVERLWQDLFLSISYFGWAGAEMRAISALDIALWDLLGKTTGQPIWQLLGGKSRDRIRTYNTCYDHLYDFNRVDTSDGLGEAGKLARELLLGGIRAMKVWPFDAAARKNRGQFITRSELQAGLRPVQQIRDAVGEDMDIAMEFHGLWNVPCAIRIAQSLEPYHILWLEEMLPQDNLKAYAMLARHVVQPLCISERLMTRFQFRELLDLGIAQFIMPDIAWCGGITEARKIACMADTSYLPLAPHNCGGPVLHAASLHLATHVPNLFILESVRRHYLVDYPDIVSDALAPRDGVFGPPAAPGLGIYLRPEFLKCPGVQIETIEN
ncbi:MAG: mandelate racemase/muconate lactonizing enzyme family protein [Planctomycetes bacterium]|nr:mandelate racemase/muconate lactonizing enzyme family protein [Planctomycetota bacterium]